MRTINQEIKSNVDYKRRMSLYSLCDEIMKDKMRQQNEIRRYEIINQNPNKRKKKEDVKSDTTK